MTMSASHRVTTQQQRRTGARTFHQLKLLQVWEPRAFEAELAACHQYGFTGIVVKALDGPAWMRTYDGSPDALSSVEQVGLQADVARAEGLYYFCWTVPLDQGDIALQATLTGQIARVCDGVLLDVEPYAQFWGAWRPEGDGGQFMRWLRLEAPQSFVALQPDPRTEHLAEIRAGEWLSGCDALCGQHYWSDFGTSSSDELGRAIELGQACGVPILPTLPGNAPLAGFAWDAIHALPGFVVWRYGSTPESNLIATGGAPVAGFSSTRIPPR